ncbi:MAG: vWA domain-containing protein [Myxococcota bacterium]
MPPADGVAMLMVVRSFRVSLWMIFPAAVTITGCTDLDVLQPIFTDELVEAPARTVDLKVLDNADCSTLFTVDHAQVDQVAPVIAARRTGYPVNPESGILEDLPRNRPVLFDVSIVDQNDRQIARACKEITLPSTSTVVDVPMRTLPTCTDEPTGLDVAVVLDTSVSMRNANISLGSEVAARLISFFDSGFSLGGDRWTLITHGPTEEPTVAVPLTADRAEIVAGIEQSMRTLEGSSRLYDATRLATIVLRSRAICGRRPALVVIAGGPDAGPRGGRQLALSGLAGDRSDLDDDLFAIGIGVSQDGRRGLDLILIENLGVASTALTADTFTAALSRTRDRLQALVGL